MYVIATTVGCSPPHRCGQNPHRFQRIRHRRHRRHHLVSACSARAPHAFSQPAIREQIGEVLALSSPIALIGMTQWSLAKLRQYLIEQKIIAHISIRWLGEILRRYKVRLRRTKTWKESTDPLFARKYRAIRRLYRRRPQGGRRLCIDEFGPLNLLPRSTFAARGPRRRVGQILPAASANRQAWRPAFPGLL